MTTEKMTLGVEIRPSREHYSKRLDVSACKIMEGGESRGLGSDNPLNCIVCSAYVGHDYGDRAENDVWGFSVRACDIFSAEAPALEAIAKALRTIERKMAKMAEVEGNADTFGQYVNRFARAIGAVKVRRVMPKRAFGWHEVRDAAWLVECTRRESYPTEAEKAARLVEAAD